jgi:hypothetical protein
MMNIEESLELLEANGVKVILTPEQKAARRARRIARREKAKRENQPYFVKIFQKTGDLGNGWWREGKPEPPEYQAFKDLDTFEKVCGKDYVKKMLDGYKLDYEDGEAGGLGWKIRSCDEREIPNDILAKLKADLAKGISHSVHSIDW